MRRLLPLLLITLLLSACDFCPLLNLDRTASSEQSAVVVAAAPPDSCPVTRPPASAFAPPNMEPASEGFFWYGTPGLWTMLPINGTWDKLPHNPSGYTQKIPWWSDGYVWLEEPLPALAVSGRRLDAPADPLLVSLATNGFEETYKSFMLTGVDFPTLGCWEITGRYGADTLTFVVWVAP